MYKWYIEFLFNSGVKKHGFIMCDFKTSNEVSQKFFQGKAEFDYVGIIDNNSASLFVKIGDISAITISTKKTED